jgi:hypothetical protein
LKLDEIAHLLLNYDERHATSDLLPDIAKKNVS